MAFLEALCNAGARASEVSRDGYGATCRFECLGVGDTLARMIAKDRTGSLWPLRRVLLALLAPACVTQSTSVPVETAPESEAAPAAATAPVVPSPVATPTAETAQTRATAETQLPAPATTIAPRRAAPPQSERDCKACNGDWGVHGISPTPSCNCRTSDGGKRCKDGSECQGLCTAADDPERDVTDPGPPARGFFVGRCSRFSTVFGCYRPIDAGAGSKPVDLTEPPQMICAD